MPFYFFTCTKCGAEFGIIRSPKEISDIKTLPCKDCDGESVRTPTGPTGATVKETIDTGLMPKSLERLADAERLFKERNRIAEKKKEE
jgi:DNA-directed RNA polymerase subunit RPC12/RpoP